MSQVAKLYARGTLFKTARQLTVAQNAEVTRIMEETWKQSDLQNAKYEFCMALGGTVANEYKDIDVGLTDVWFVMWKATVDALYHRPKKFLKIRTEATCSNCGQQDIHDNGRGILKPTATQCTICSSNYLAVPKNFLELSVDAAEAWYRENVGEVPVRDRTIVENKKVRKKFYQTMIFNYLRQIIKENAFDKVTATNAKVGLADDVTIKLLKAILERGKVKSVYEASQDHHFFELDTPMLPLDVVQQVSNLREQMLSQNVVIEVIDEGITIETVGKVPIISRDVVEKVRLKQLSFSNPANDDDDDDMGAGDHLQAKIKDPNALDFEDVDWSDATGTVRERLTDKAAIVFDLIMHQPEDYRAQFGESGVKRIHLSRYLGISPKEVKRIYNEIELQMRAVCLTPDMV